jgi:GntR family L-lactate dehydrogenase operon transcriptional regulator
LESATHPVGSRQATQALIEQGFRLSESTVSRLLRRLDAQQLTVSVDGKGRVLTDAGRRWLKTATDASPAAANASSLPDIRNIRDLLDLLYARRTVEREVAREAALRANPQDIELLEALLEEHGACLDQGRTGRGPALEFHRQIGHASHNSVLAHITSHVLDRRLDALEAALDVIVGVHHSAHLSIDEHAAILEAIRAGQPDEAERAMERHVSRLIREVEEDLATDRAGIYERLFAWMKEQQIGE